MHQAVSTTFVIVVEPRRRRPDLRPGRVAQIKLALAQQRGISAKLDGEQFRRDRVVVVSFQMNGRPRLLVAWLCSCRYPTGRSVGIASRFSQIIDRQIGKFGAWARQSPSSGLCRRRLRQLGQPPQPPSGVRRS
jgi:hypothetical protein